MGLYADTLFGNDVPNTAQIPAYMLNQSAANSTDWGAIISDGIRGAAQGAIDGLVREKFQDGQLKAQAANNNNMMKWLVIGAVVYLLVK